MQALNKVELTYQRVGIDLALKNAIGILEDGTRIQLPLIGAEISFSYPEKTHLAKLAMHGFRVDNIIEED